MKEQRLLVNKNKNKVDKGNDKKAEGDKCSSKQKEKTDCEKCKELMKLI